MTMRYRPQNMVRVQLVQGEDLNYWTRALDCSEAELHEAMAVAGTARASVERFLRARRASTLDAWMDRASAILTRSRMR